MLPTGIGDRSVGKLPGSDGFVNRRTGLDKLFKRNGGPYCEDKRYACVLLECKSAQGLFNSGLMLSTCRAEMSRRRSSNNQQQKNMRNCDP